MNAIASQLKPLIGTAEICEWENLDERWQKQIKAATSPENIPSCIVYPHTPAELAEVMACAYRNKWQMLVCGNGSKLSWGGIVKNAQIVISTQRMQQLIEHAVGDLTVTVEAGMQFAHLQAQLAKLGQFLALDPDFPQSATMGGIVATASTGSLRQRYGSVRDQLLGINFVRADGQVASAGGRVVKNVAGYDLMKLFTGAYGTLGAISSVTFRVYPLPETSATTALTGTAEEVAKVCTILRASALTPTNSDILSTGLVASLGIGEGLGLITRFRSLKESVQEQSTRLLEVGQQLGLQGKIYLGDEEAELGQKLQIQMQASSPPITCKIGVLPAQAVATLTELDRIAGQKVIAWIHNGSGLGSLQLGVDATIEIIEQMRSLCQSHKGFLTVLTAPQAIKQNIDVWGYSGNAIDLMQRIKQQFDPENLLSPNRFL
jgi:glycolate oxidase FAD binding subunit